MAAVRRQQRGQGVVGRLLASDLQLYAMACLEYIGEAIYQYGVLENFSRHDGYGSCMRMVRPPGLGFAFIDFPVRRLEPSCGSRPFVSLGIQIIHFYDKICIVSIYRRVKVKGYGACDFHVFE
jgi:hypothetical protein